MSKIKVTVKIEGKTHHLFASKGSNLREVLLAQNFNQFNCLFEDDHCEGTGLCANCGVLVEKKSASPNVFQQKKSCKTFHPLLSCEVIVLEPIVIDLATSWQPQQKVKRKVPKRK